jgi:hypothetical protein
MSTKEHTFDSTSDAYDAVQCDETIRNGDVLVIENERVIGLAWTWPVAVTVEHGALHTVNGNGVSVIKDATWTVEQIKAAIAAADERGLKVADWAREAVEIASGGSSPATDYRELAAARGFDIQDTDEGYTWTARHFVMNSAGEFDTEQEAWDDINSIFPATE